MKGCDFESGPTPAELLEAGIFFVCRYACSLPNGKALTRAEANGYTEAGMGIVTVWEDQAQAALGGAAQGMADGVGAAAFARALGQPPGSAIYVAFDFDVSQAQISVCLDYLRAFRSVVAESGYVGGPYGGILIVNEAADEDLVQCYYWQTEAWSNGQVSRFADLLQLANPTYIAGKQVDIDEVVNNVTRFGAWNYDGLWPKIVPKPPTPKPPFPPIPEEIKDMAPTVTFDSEGNAYVAGVSTVPNNEGHLLVFKNPKGTGSWLATDVTDQIHHEAPNAALYTIES
jgi:hypothetical protein